MAANCGKGSSADNDGDVEETPGKHEHVPNNSLSLSRLHNLLDGMAKDAKNENSKEGDDDNEDDMDPEDEAHAKATHQSPQMKHALQVATELWPRRKEFVGQIQCSK